MADIRTELEKARLQLLDLSTRNRLLSIPQGDRAKLLRIDDELSAEVFRLLVVERKAMGFLPGDGDQDNEPSNGAAALPEPDDDSEDEPGGIAARHVDTKLQTRLNPDALQRRLLSLFFDARTAIEEQGVNTLYLALGQLKWRDDKNSDMEYFAPLVLVPVALERSNVRSRFKLRALDQDPSDNLSLGAKLQEFGIVVPAFEWQDDFSIPDYLAEYEKAVSGQPGWQVLKDGIVLGFFPSRSS